MNGFTNLFGTLLVLFSILLVTVKGTITPQSSSVKGNAGQTVTIQWTYDTTGQIALLVDYKTPSGVYKTIASGASSDSTLTIASNYKPFDPRLIASTNSVNKVTATISGLKCEDEGNFMLKLVPSSETSEISLSVQVLPDGTPTITQPSGSLVEGQNATFTCKVNLGKPAGTIEWYKNSNKVTTAATLTKSTNNQYSCSKDGTSTLVVALDTTDNGAVYKCQVVPDASLTVTSPPMKEFTALDVKYNVRLNNPQTGIKPEPVTAVEGLTVTLDCIATGNPDPTYTWTATPVVTSSDTTGATYTTSVLTMSNNEDVYECTATNTVNGQTTNVSKKFELKVTEKPTTTQAPATTSPLSTTPSKSSVTPIAKDSKSSNNPSTDNTAAIAGGIAGGVVAVILIVVIIFVCKKKKNRTVNEGKGNSNSNNPGKMYSENACEIDLEDQKPDLLESQHHGNSHPDDDPRKKNAEGLVYAELALDNTPRSRNPIQTAHTGESDFTEYAEIRRPPTK